MTAMRWVYLIAAIIGAVVPMRYFIAWFSENGVSLSGIVAVWKANAAVTGLYWDLVIAAIVLTIWIVFETVQRRNWRGLIAIPATFCIGVSCGLPLYLFLRDTKRSDAV